MSRIDTIRQRLPKRLTISFPIWGLFDTSDTGDYHDLEKMVVEHAERGFNCIRLEGGAGLTHDLDGNRREPVFITAPFGKYSTNRQTFSFGGEGYCDVMQRLIDLCVACKKHNVYLILSSWYFLHTYWYVPTELNDKLFSIPTEDVFMSFAKFLHYILRELEERDLADRIAFAEIFNEVNAVPGFISELKHENNKHINFKAKHEEALAWLMQQHPDTLFALDADRVSDAVLAKLPNNFQVFNGHNYFLWDIYRNTLENGPERKEEFFRHKISVEDVAATRNGKYPLPTDSRDWFYRLASCNDLEQSKMNDLNTHLEERLAENWGRYIENLENFCKGYQHIMSERPDALIVCGEGVTYCSAQDVLWEERSELFWNMVRYARKRYKEIGLWGSVIKTCCGPEDPCWTLCADKLKELNEEFLAD